MRLVELEQLNELDRDKKVTWTADELEVAADLGIPFEDIEANIERIRDMIEMVEETKTNQPSRWDWFYDVYLEGKDEFKIIY